MISSARRVSKWSAFEFRTKRRPSPQLRRLRVSVTCHYDEHDAHHPPPHSSRYAQAHGRVSESQPYTAAQFRRQPRSYRRIWPCASRTMLRCAYESSSSSGGDESFWPDAGGGIGGRCRRSKNGEMFSSVVWFVLGSVSGRERNGGRGRTLRGNSGRCRTTRSRRRICSPCP
jgi:hypothetical protein